MKKFTKILSMVLLVAMCMSMLTVSAFADGEHSCAAYIEKWGEGKGQLHPAVAPSCTADGTIKFYMCGQSACDKCYRDEECTDLIASASDLIVPAGHSFTTIPAVEPDCKSGGNLEYKVCSGCGAVADPSGTIHTNGASDFALSVKADAHVYDEDAWEVTKAATTTAKGEETNYCLICNAPKTRETALAEAAFAVTAKNGKNTYTYSDANDTYIYNANKELDRVEANGTVIQPYAYDKTTGLIILDGSKFSASTAVTIDLVFYSKSGEVVGGFCISKPANQKVEELEINGVGDMTYVKGTKVNVNFKTNSELNYIVLYDLNDRVPVDAIFSSQINSVTGIYTYTFDTAYLESLDCHKYQIRCYHGYENDAYTSAGYLTISNAPVSVDNTLQFTNGDLGDARLFKYQSGAEEPRLYSPLFTVSGARLQVKSDNTGWSDVNVYNYLIEQKNGESTAYAFIDDAYLNTFDSDDNYYFRVMVPESKMGTSEPVTSNTVTLQVGATLRAVDTNKHVINSTKNLKFVCSEEIAEVYVGNIQLTSDDDFAVSTNKKNITLSADFLN